MTHGSLYSGMGGFDLAAEWMGWQTVFQVERNKFCQHILNYYWPHARKHRTMEGTDFTIYRGRIFCLSGGFPCPPFSQAGKRKGEEDPRYQWPEMRRAIREIQPRWVVPENVLGLVSWKRGVVFDKVSADLEAEGYEVVPVVLPASAVDAPHRRDRVFFCAFKDTNIIRFDGHIGEAEPGEWGFRKFGTGNDGRVSSSSNTTVEGLQKRKRGKVHGSTSIEKPERHSDGDVANTNVNGSVHGSGQDEVHSNQGGFNAQHDAASLLDASDSGTSRWKELHLASLASGPGYHPGLANGAWEEWPIEPALCFGDDGLSAHLDHVTFPQWRKRSLEAAGNAVVPQVVYQIFKTIEAYEKSIIHSL